MKTGLVIGIGSVASFLMLLTLALVLKSAKPEWFGGTSKAPDQAAAAKGASSSDSTSRGAADSTQIAASVTTTDSTKAPVDTVMVAQLSTKAKVLESQVDSLKRQLAVKPKADTASVQQDWKSTAKLIESMSPEDATKILKEMNDYEVKQVLAKIKKRQAGKILATLDPVRAAKLLR